jgi:hypothetical protein
LRVDHEKLFIAPAWRTGGKRATNIQALRVASIATMLAWGGGLDLDVVFFEKNSKIFENYFFQIIRKKLSLFLKFKFKFIDIILAKMNSFSYICYDLAIFNIFGT